MALFLSPEWIAELDAVARASERLAAALGDGGLTVQQIVQDTPDGEARYYLTHDGGAARVRAGSAESPDLTFVTEYESARAIHAGEMNAQQVIMTGGFKMRGNPDVLIARGEVLDALEDVFAAVRANTSFPG